MSAPAAGIDISTLLGRLAFAVLSVSLLALVMAWDALGSPWGPVASTVLAFALFALHLGLVRRRISGFDPIVWIPIAMLVFYFGLTIANEMLLSTPRGYDTWIVAEPKNLERGFAAHLLALAAFLWGLHLAGTRDLSGAPRKTALDTSLRVPGLLMLGGATAMVAFGIALVGPSVVFASYDVWWDAKQSGADARFVDMGLIFAISGIFAILASDTGPSPRRYLAYFASLVVGAILVLKGDRTALVGLGIGFGWCYSQRIRRIPFVLVVFLAFVAILGAPVIKEFRLWRSIEFTSQTGLIDLLAAAFSEMGSSTLALAYTIDLMPPEPYRWGMSYLTAMIDLIPNFGLTPGKGFSLMNPANQGSYWITAVLAPDWFANGGGFGYSMDAELYFNFGMPSVLLGMAFFGWTIGSVRNASQDSALRLVWSAMFFVAMIIYVRNIIGFPLRVAIWPGVGLFVLRSAVGMLGGTASTRARPAAVGSAPV